MSHDNFDVKVTYDVQNTNSNFIATNEIGSRAHRKTDAEETPHVP